ncbi:MAG TPA: DUF3306 domain-containing protein [Ideonella sp.]|uniref:DUF3306 domain-containing protein n=1 Tax=Ideonella sp. TaxID=1929293 RepID=UPI002E312720|nr:DUF3306 domain-containing protein [Ideonella sp.]HEX5688060.1 DUF3306 domain-containing protein [Ideonella sp.]
MSVNDSDFLARWSQRKVQARQGRPLGEDPPAVPMVVDTAPPIAPAPTAIVEPQPPSADTLPTMDEVATLTPVSDFSRFVARGVEPGVKNAALKKLFADPHFNLMDGLDTYIEDFGRADPLPASMLKQMAQAHFLGLIEPERSPDPAPTSSPPGASSSAAAATDEDPDLRLQSHDAAGRQGPEPGAGGDAGREP